MHKFVLMALLGIQGLLVPGLAPVRAGPEGTVTEAAPSRPSRSAMSRPSGALPAKEPARLISFQQIPPADPGPLSGGGNPATDRTEAPAKAPDEGRLVFDESAPKDKSGGTSGGKATGS